MPENAEDKGKEEVSSQPENLLDKLTARESNSMLVYIYVMLTSPL